MNSVVLISNCRGRAATTKITVHYLQYSLWYSVNWWCFTHAQSHTLSLMQPSVFTTVHRTPTFSVIFCNSLLYIKTMSQWLGRCCSLCPFQATVALPEVILFSTADKRCQTSSERLTNEAIAQSPRQTTGFFTLYIKVIRAPRLDLNNNFSILQKPNVRFIFTVTVLAWT